MVLNSLLDNDLIFYGIFISVAGAIGYSFVTSYFNPYLNKVDKGTQTDAWEDYSDRPSQILQTSTTSIDTQTPKFSPIEYTSSSSQTIESPTTVLPIRPMNIEVLPNRDITSYSSIEMSNKDVQTVVQMIDRGIQTKPDMKIDLSHLNHQLSNFDPGFPLIEPSIDLDLAEAYIPFPGMIVDVATSMANYYPMCMG